MLIPMDYQSGYIEIDNEKGSATWKMIKNDENEFRRKDRIISELEEQLELKIFLMSFLNEHHLQKTLFANDAEIQNLISEKKALHGEVRSLAIILQKIQETAVNMNEEDKRVFSPLLEFQEDSDMVVTEEDIDIIYPFTAACQKYDCSLGKLSKIHLQPKLPVWTQEKIEVSSSFSVLFSAPGLGHLVADM
ncbi:hypothetical protein Peur_018932 [Populus x canadensis]